MGNEVGLDGHQQGGERPAEGQGGSEANAGVLARRAAVGFGALAFAFKRTFLDTADAFERYQTTLETVEGSSEAARRSMQWISDFAVTTPFEFEQVTESFVRLRAYGLDPTNGLLRTLGDTAAAMGKPVMQAVEAIADAVTGENERLKEFGVKARVQPGGAIRYEYTLDGATRFAEALADDREQIQRVLTGIFEARFAGAMQKQAQTFSGLISNLMDQWTRFQQMVMGSGAFDFLKTRLEGFLATIDRMAADGSLQQLAELVGQRLVAAFEAAQQAVVQIWPWLVRIGNAFAWAAEKMGGWGNLAVAMAGGYIAKPFIGMAGGLLPMSTGTVATAAAGAGATASTQLGMLARLGPLLKPLAVLAGLLSIKFLAIGAAVAVVAGLVYKYWEPIKAFLIGVWQGFMEAFQPVFDALEPAFQAIGEWLQPLIDWFKQLFVPVEMTAEELSGFAAAGRRVGKMIAGLILNIGEFIGGLIALPVKIGEAGVRLVDAIIKGIKSAGPRLVETITGLFDRIAELLPFSDAKRGPLSRLTAAGSAIVETMGQGVLQAGSAALEQPLVSTLGTAAAPTQAALAAGAPAGISIQNLVINQQPGEDAQALADKFLREIERRRQLSQREALYDNL